MNKKQRVLAIAAQLAIFFVFAWVLTAWPYANYLREIEGQSLFVPTATLWHWHMLLPAGLLSWAGSWLTQFFYHPVLGGGIYALMLTGLGWLGARAMGLKAKWFGLALIVPAMLLLVVLAMGYSIYSLKSPGFAFSLVLGFGFALGWLWACRSIKWQWLRAVMAIAIPAAYPWLGFYALLASALCALSEVLAMRGKSSGGKIAAIAIAVAACASLVVVPRIYFSHGWQLVPMADLYKSGLPVYYPTETLRWAPFWVIGLVIAIGMALGLLGGSNAETAKASKSLVKALAPSVAALALAIAAVLTFRISDPNFMLTMDMRQAVANEDWEGALKARRAYGDLVPTRVNVLYTAIALWRMDQAGERLFTFPAGSADYESTRGGTVMRDIIAQDISMHMGRVHSAYRWCMEYCVEYGVRVAYLKDMVMCAMLNGELKLAQKYLDTLKQTMWHRPWVDKYQAYINDPDKMHEDPTLKSIKLLTFYRDHIGGDGGKLESYLMPLTASLSGGTPELQRLTLDCNLVQKDIDGFMTKLQALVQETGVKERLPRHYQEAVLLWCMVHENSAYTRFNIDPKVLSDFKRFNAMAKTAQAQGLTDTEAQAKLFKEPFGDTYWYYFFFTLNMKTK